MLKTRLQSFKSLVSETVISKEFKDFYDIMQIDEYLYLWCIHYTLDIEEEKDGTDDARFPLKILRTNDLTEVDFKELSNGQDPPKRDFVNDPWNKPYLEKIDYEAHLEDAQKQSLTEYRIMLEKTCVTDGKYIYALCYYVEDIIAFQTNATKIEVEVYCPKTLNFIRSCTLIPKAAIDENLPQKDKDKISKANRKLLKAYEDLPDTFEFAATNGRDIAL